MGLTLKEYISIGAKTLADAGVENAKHDAETLFAFATGIDRRSAFLDPERGLDEAPGKSYLRLIERRAGGEPLQYITEEQYFFGYRFHVDARVLIPRPETECLAEMAIEYLLARSAADSGVGADFGLNSETGIGSDSGICTDFGPGVGPGPGHSAAGAGARLAALDLCTGSGALAVSIAKACPHIKIIASDISEAALEVARGNARDLEVSGNIDFVKSDLFDCFYHGGATEKLHGDATEKLHGDATEKFGLIVTNPPYIRTGELDGLQREVRDHEPLSALDGGPDGLDFYRRIAGGARGLMRDGGCLMAEIGHDQARDVSAIFKAAGFQNIGIYQDLAGLDRILTAE